LQAKEILMHTLFFILNFMVIAAIPTFDNSPRNVSAADNSTAAVGRVARDRFYKNPISDVNFSDKFSSLHFGQISPQKRQT
jgi:hypothetical protein